jgi:hypothetical protein
MLRCSTSPYPTQHAFVVQFAAHTALDAEDLTGRVEHVVSGQATQFHSLQALFEFVVQVLQAVHASEDEGNFLPGHPDAE